MGADHVRTLTRSVPGVRVTAVHDPDVARAEAVAATVSAAVPGSADELVSSADVDAVLVASPDHTHAALVLACLAAGKPVLCEKPLAPTAAGALEVVRAEAVLGRRLVQVGFMRRFDPGFCQLKRAVAEGVVGQVRVVHAVHRNASSSTSTDDAGLVTGSMVHELDTVPWLLDDAVVAVRVESPVTAGFRDPQLATLWLRGGAMATVEVFVNAGYGYDVRCELVGDRGTAALASTNPVSTRVAGVEGVAVRDDFVAHFADAYRLELAAWAHAAAAGGVTGPSAWDGYLATLAAEAGVASLASGAREDVVAVPTPPLYR
jgi:myo-inositol 2-dehydrogenase/D-chiro-inositol 1-dehydrogenase